MSVSLYWLYWAFAFLGVLAVLTIGVAVQEFMDWRKGNKK